MDQLLGPSHHPHLWLMLPIHHVSVTGMFRRSHFEDSPVSHPLQYIHSPSFHDRHPESCILRSFSPPLKSFALFYVIDVGFIKALLWRIASCQHQLIIQEVDLGTTLLVLWSLHASMASFSLVATGLHHWPSTEIFCMVFDAKSLFHTMWIVCSTLRVIIIIGDSSRACEQLTSLAGNQAISFHVWLQNTSHMDWLVLWVKIKWGWRPRI